MSYCGPAALSAITGTEVDHCVRVLRHMVTGKPVRRLRHWHMQDALYHLGYNTQAVALPLLETITLAAWLARMVPDQTYLVVITGHYIVVHGKKIIDNHNPQGVFLRQYQHRRTRVKRVWLIKKRETPATSPHSLCPATSYE